MMEVKIIRIITLAAFVLFPHISHGEYSPDEKHDFHVLLSRLLAVNSDIYTYTGKDGEQHTDSLRLFKELERIYIKNIKPDLDDEKFSVKRLKMVMYFSFYADVHNSAAIQEYLAADLMPIFEHNKETFSRILAELPFLLPSNCERLSAFFGNEGENEGEEVSFIANNKELLSRHLSTDQLAACIGYFEKPDHSIE